MQKLYSSILFLTALVISVGFNYKVNMCWGAAESLYRSATFNYSGHTEGIILKKETIESCRNRYGPQYKTVLTYEYEVNGSTFQSSVIHNGRHVSPESSFVEGLQENMNIFVYYDKDNPNNAVLYTRGITLNWLPIVGMLFWSLLIFMIIPWYN